MYKYIYICMYMSTCVHTSGYTRDRVRKFAKRMRQKKIQSYFDTID